MLYKQDGSLTHAELVRTLRLNGESEDAAQKSASTLFGQAGRSDDSALALDHFVDLILAENVS